MQLLPSVGKAMAREEGMTHFQTFQLLDPETNIQLGTRYLRQMLDKFGGVQEYALAAYNAGDNRVDRLAVGRALSGIDEFVESIPFTQTREYVQAILRNEETYRAIDSFARTRSERQPRRRARHWVLRWQNSEGRQRPFLQWPVRGSKRNPTCYSSSPIRIDFSAPHAATLGLTGDI